MKAILIKIVLLIGLPLLLLNADDFDSVSTASKTQFSTKGKDLGHWVSVKSGFQAEGGTIDERWSIAGMYEYRYSKFTSLPVEVHFFRDRVIHWNGLQNLKFLQTRTLVAVSLKGRFYITSNINSFIFGGMSTGVGVTPYSFEWGGGSEILLNKKMGIFLDAKKNSFTEFNWFLSIGVNLSLAD